METAALGVIHPMSAAVPLVYGNKCDFMAVLAEAAQRALFLDYDGTIAPFTVDRKRAMPYRQVPGLVQQLMTECETRVVLITGRPAKELPSLLGVTPHPEIWGTHGMERLTPDGHYSVGYIGAQALGALDTAAKWANEQKLGSLLERKPGAVALHWRGYAPASIETIRERAYQAFAPLACRANLLLCEFDAGLELRVRSCDKGHAVRAVMAEMEEGAPVAYLGDDLSDEDAFRALNGRGFTALVSNQYRPTAADVWLKPPDDLIGFLAEWIVACGGTA